MNDSTSLSKLNFAVGKKLQYLRVLKGISQQNVADDLNISTSTYSKWENGKVDITVGRLEQLATYFEVYLPDFLEPDLQCPRLKSAVKSPMDYEHMESRFEFLKEIMGTKF
ncbi:MAG: helix-turn-helix transcriptional regulator [Bacteroidales bacterium]|jgi:transcriptional regulator with XRE-family HTH domain|nr:helix-turn-helix transcriptional regulator [Bacteroidales bacterium]MDD4771100.1 helix-turn-helix transcriptional regulator [Bacteroidales bacterium]